MMECIYTLSLSKEFECLFCFRIIEFKTITSDLSDLCVLCLSAPNQPAQVLIFLFF